MTAKKKKTSQKSSLIGGFTKGRTLSLEFFKANIWLLLLFMVMIIALIGLRYKTKTKMAEIKHLTTELQRAESSKLQEKSLYMSLVRESEMVKMVRERNLNLQFQDQPPYILNQDASEEVSK